MSTPQSSCVFCPPRSEFAVIFENDHAVAIIVINAKSWGHALIIPKEHSSNLASSGMDETIWKGGMVPLLRKTIKQFRKNPQVIGFHINSNAGSSAEQTVFHTHIHLVPQYKKDRNKWISFLNSNFTGFGSKRFNGRWDTLYQDMMNHINWCLKQGFLSKKGGIIESFNLLARIGDGELDSEEHLEIIPKTSTSNYHWGGGGNYYNFSQRQIIAERIKKAQWEEEKTDSQEENNIEKISCLVQLDTANNDNPEDEGILYYIFISGDGKYTIKIDRCHPNLNQRSRVPRKKDEAGNTLWYKLSWKKSEPDKRRFEKEDFIEIEEPQPQKDNNNNNDNQIPEQNNDNQSPTNSSDLPTSDTENGNKNNEPTEEKPTKKGGKENDPTPADGKNNKPPEKKKKNNQDVSKLPLVEAKKVAREEITKLFANGKLTKKEFENYQKEINQATSSTQIANLLQKIQANSPQNTVKPTENNALKAVGIVSLILIGGFLFILLVGKIRKRRQLNK